MTKLLKWIGVFFGVVFGLAALALGSIFFITQEQIERVYDAPVRPVVVPSGPAAVERGRHIIETRGICIDCHGADLGGQIMDDAPLIGRLVAPNLTSGMGGIGAEYTNEDWVRAIRHGIGRDNKSLIAMMSNIYYYLDDADLGNMIAYLKTLPPIDNELPETSIGIMARIFILQDPSILSAQVIDHEARRMPNVPPGATEMYGAYLAGVCTLCHGDNLAGGDDVGAGVNLTPGGDLGRWREDDFLNTMRTGINPDGKALDPDLMPWEYLGKMTDDELKAIWLYLQTLPSIPNPTPTP